MIKVEVGERGVFFGLERMGDGEERVGLRNIIEVGRKGCMIGFLFRVLFGTCFCFVGLRVFEGYIRFSL